MNMRDTLCRIEQALSVPAAEYVPAIRDVFDIIDAARNELDREAQASRPQTSAPGGEGTAQGGYTESARQRFDRLMQDDAASPLERLRFFCSLAMSGQDWIDVEPFFDALRAPTERTPLTGANFDEWSQNPYTLVLQESIRNDYMPKAGVAGTQAAADVLAERRRQVSAEGWTPEHDDLHSDGSLAAAGACYAMHTAIDIGISAGRIDRYAAPARRFDKFMPDYWPWDRDWWKPNTRRRNLVKAGALILAEIERLDRASLSGEGE